ncbi:MAG: glycoside hydrolase family 97 protein [Bacteroidales bacterium]|nr:glycoside hydrolase family 97 protein [Bacteroidales bacterium]
MKRFLLLLFITLSISIEAKQQNFSLASPDGLIVANIAALDGSISYSVSYKSNTLILPSRIALHYTQGDNEFSTLHIRNTSRRTVDQIIPSHFTRQSTMRDHFNELTLQLKNGLALVFRAYNEGLAYRFVWQGPAGHVINETVEYQFPHQPTATVPYVISFDSTRHDIQYSTSFENLYTTAPLSKLDHRRLCFLPLLIHANDDIKVCITESALLSYPGLYLHTSKEESGKESTSSTLVGEHAPLPRNVVQGGHNNLQLLVKEREDYIAVMDRQHVFPWRIAMVAGSSTQLATNNLSYLLAEPSRLDDISWIHPGKVAWDWWNNWNIGGVDFIAGINNNTYKHYIDFAANYGIEYVILDEGWAVNMQADLFQVVPEIDLPMLVQYAKERGVGIILWAGYYAFERDMEQVCRHYSEMGVKGFKIDFMDRDDQLAADFYRRAAEACARHHLLVDFHGAYKPAGLNRTYPNVLNFEGVAGLEQLKWAPSTWDQIQYDVEIPYIRQAAGPMDYTQGAMNNAARGCYFPSWSEPMSQGTRCHQLALYIVLESPINMLCDSPTNYMREPDYTRFLAAIPTVWDETRVPQGEVGEYIVTARRSGNSWYIGGITNWTARDINLDLSKLLPEGTTIQSIEHFADGINAHRKGSDYRRSTLSPTTSELSIHMAPGGGFLLKIQQLNN